MEGIALITDMVADMVADMQAYAFYTGLAQRGSRTARTFEVLTADRVVAAVQYLGEAVVYIDHKHFGLRPTHGVVATAVREATAALLASAARQQAIRAALSRAGVR